MNGERRSNKRFERVIYFRIIPSGMETQQVLNISVGGFCIAVSELHDISDIIDIKLFLLGESLYCQGRVVWIYPTSRHADIRRIGLEFLNLSSQDQERLKNMLHEDHYELC